MLIILDRDGVINYDSKVYIKNPDEWIPIPGSLEAIARLKQRGHTVVVATNQSGVNRGYYSLETLREIHEKMRRVLIEVGGHIDGIYFCPHTPEEHCACRKPEPGLLLQIKADFPDEFSSAILVGDSYRDILAAHRANCKAALVKTGNGHYTLAMNYDLKGVPIFENLSAFADSVTKSR